MEYLKTIPKKDLILMMEISRELLSSKKLCEMKCCLKRLQSLVLHDESISIFTNINTIHAGNPLYEFSATGWPEELLETYIQGKYYSCSSVINTALMINQPCHWDTIWSKSDSDHDIIIQKLFMEYGYKDGWICSTIYQHNRDIGFLAIIGKKVETDLRCAAIMEYITPYFSEAVKSMFFSKINKIQQIRKFKLTRRQSDVLRWIKEGKTAWEISVILNCSERVVIWHANNILQKLGAQNRAHAVAIAMRNKLID